MDSNDLNKVRFRLLSGYSPNQGAEFIPKGDKKYTGKELLKELKFETPEQFLDWIANEFKYHIENIGLCGPCCHSVLPEFIIWCESLTEKNYFFNKLKEMKGTLTESEKMKLVSNYAIGFEDIFRALRPWPSVKELEEALDYYEYSKKRLEDKEARNLKFQKEELEKAAKKAAKKAEFVKEVQEHIVLQKSLQNSTNNKRTQFVKELEELNIEDRIEHIINSSEPINYFPEKFANIDSKDIDKLPKELIRRFYEKLEFASRGSLWKDLRKTIEKNLSI